MVFNPEIEVKTKFLDLYHHMTKKATRLKQILKTPLSKIYDWIEKIKEDLISNIITPL